MTKEETKIIREALIEHKLARLDTGDAIIDILLRNSDADVIRSRLMSVLLHDCARATSADLGILNKAVKVLDKYDGGIAGLQAKCGKAVMSKAKPKPIFVPIPDKKPATKTVKPATKVAKCLKPTAKSAKK